MAEAASSIAPAIPSVTVAVPVYNGGAHLGRCLEAVSVQGYPRIAEVLVVDGGSSDDSRSIAERFERVRILDNPRRSRPAAMNLALEVARGDVIVRVDARTVIAHDYVSRCVAALAESGAAIVGGPMRLTAESALERGIRAAMMSKLGGGPAEFRRESEDARFVDTVYLGAFRRSTIASIGGYDEVFGGNEDAELAFRAQRAGGVYLDPAIHSSYAVRDGYLALWSQYLRYGRARAGTIRKHPASLSTRQLAVPALFAGLIGPYRRPVAIAYLAAVGARSATEAQRDLGAALPMLLAFPTMHFAWGAGFAAGLLRRHASGA